VQAIKIYFGGVKIQRNRYVGSSEARSRGGTARQSQEAVQMYQVAGWVPKRAGDRAGCTAGCGRMASFNARGDGSGVRQDGGGRRREGGGDAAGWHQCKG
jgi:hypothetical protein